MNHPPQVPDGPRLRQALHPVAERYVNLNLAHLSGDRYRRTIDSPDVGVSSDRSAGTDRVTAKADLGGTLFASSLPLFACYTDPETIEVEAGVECGTDLAEVVLAVDVAASMHERAGGHRKIEDTLPAADALLDVLYAGCGEASAADGIVHWDKTAHLDGAAARRRQYRRWVDLSRHRESVSDWDGCLEDRAHDTGDDSAGAPGLPLALPRGAQASPGFLNHETRGRNPRVVADAAALVLDAFPSPWAQPATVRKLPCDPGLRRKPSARMRADRGEPHGDPAFGLGPTCRQPERTRRGRQRISSGPWLLGHRPEEHSSRARPVVGTFARSGARGGADVLHGGDRRGARGQAGHVGDAGEPLLRRGLDSGIWTRRLPLPGGRPRITRGGVPRGRASPAREPGHHADAARETPGTTAHDFRHSHADMCLGGWASRRLRMNPRLTARSFRRDLAW